VRIAYVTLVALLLSFLSQSPAFAVGIDVVVLEDRQVDICPVCKKPVYPGDIHQDAVTTVETLLQKGLDEKKIKYAMGKEEPRRLNVLIYKFQERRGGNFAVERPASVGFHAHLFEGTTLDRVIEYDETQRPLSENLFGFFTFLRRGMRWLTAAQLAGEGIDKALDKLEDDIK
jgi:hypothetical protein